MLKENSPRNLVIISALLVIVLILAGLLLWGSKPSPDDESPPSDDDVVDVDDVVEIIVGAEPVPIPEVFKESLQKLGITGLALIELDDTGEDETSKVRAITIDGTYTDLCGPRLKESTGARTCKLDTTVKALVRAVGGSNEGAECYPTATSGDPISCHATGNNKNTFKWHDKRKSHKECYSSCE